MKEMQHQTSLVPIHHGDTFTQLIAMSTRENKRLSISGYYVQGNYRTMIEVWFIVSHNDDELEFENINTAIEHYNSIKER